MLTLRRSAPSIHYVKLSHGGRMTNLLKFKTKVVYVDSTEFYGNNNFYHSRVGAAPDRYKS
jgi:hypothetical protein